MKKPQKIPLFEYQNSISISDTGIIEGEFNDFLDKVWEKRPKSAYFRDIKSESDEPEEFDKDIDTVQKFISFFGKSTNRALKATKYVGVIHYKNKVSNQDYVFNLLPKIFYTGNKDIDDSLERLGFIQQHILWYLSYSKRFKFPKLDSSFNKLKFDSFFEVLVWMFAAFTRDLLTKLIYQNYTEINNEIPFLKGRLNINEYIKNNLCTGNWTKLNCTYDSFEIDNQLNRIIKFVAKLLHQVSKVSDNKKLLHEISFILDEVTDVQATAAGCERVKINPLFSELQTVLDYCKLFLSNSMIYTYKNDLKVFAFLIPMEKIFEEFVAGFMEKHKLQIFDGKSVEIKTQASDKYLAYKNADPKKDIYQLKNDILIKIDDASIIIDTKYKLAYLNQKNEIVPAQSDMYQMLSYAVRRGCDKVCLIYPATINENEHPFPTENPDYLMKDEFVFDKLVSAYILKIPIIAPNCEKINFSDLNIDLSNHFRLFFNKIFTGS